MIVFTASQGILYFVFHRNNEGGRIRRIELTVPVLYTSGRRFVEKEWMQEFVETLAAARDAARDERPEMKTESTRHHVIRSRRQIASTLTLILNVKNQSQRSCVKRTGIALTTRIGSSYYTTNGVRFIRYNNIIIITMMRAFLLLLCASAASSFVAPRPAHALSRLRPAVFSSKSDTDTKVPLIINGKNVELTDALIEHVNKRIGGVVNKLSGNSVVRECDVILSVSKNPKVKSCIVVLLCQLLYL